MTPSIPGLSFEPDFITEDEEQALLFEIAGVEMSPRVRVPIDSRTTIVRWGVAVYGGYLASSKIPAWLGWLCDQVPMIDRPTSVTLNVWAPGDQLAPHIDKGGPVVCVLNLLGISTIAFSGPHVQIYEVPRRALMRLEADARHTWEHACFPAEHRRISLVFRTAA